MTQTQEQFSNHEISLTDKFPFWLIWSIKPPDKMLANWCDC